MENRTVEANNKIIKDLFPEYNLYKIKGSLSTAGYLVINKDSLSQLLIDHFESIKLNEKWENENQ